MSEEQNIEDQSVNDGPQSIENVNENISELSTTNYQPQTENMEVHKHPHHVTHKKKWGEYLLEFFMIFLAVTLGFFAESLREHINNNNIEKEYMQSMVTDLKADTTAITKAIFEWSVGNTALDSIERSLKVHPTDVNGFYRSLSEDFWHFDLFKYDNKTVEELKSSGNFRLIRNRKIESLIMSYDLDMKYILIQEQDVKEVMMASKFAETRVADYSQIHFRHFNYDSSYSLLSNDRQLIGEYYNKLIAFKKLATYHEYLFRQILVEAKYLLQMIQKEYHFE